MNTGSSVKEEFSRNIGLLSEDEQKKLLSSRIAVAGAGGVGGLHILTLARLGIGKFTIADPDEFERVNINRQYGATHSTVGKNKAEVLGHMIRDINPDADVSVLRDAISAENADSFLSGADLFIDGIDFFEVDVRRLIFSKVRSLGIYALTAAPLGFGATLQVFAPGGMSFDEYFGISDDMEYREKVAAFAAGLAPRPYHIRYLDLSRVSLENKTGPALSLACTLAASLVGTETVKILTNKAAVKPVPHYLQIDLLRRKYKEGYLFMGGKNPIQKLKKLLILRKASSGRS